MKARSGETRVSYSDLIGHRLTCSTKDELLVRLSPQRPSWVSSLVFYPDGCTLSTKRAARVGRRHGTTHVGMAMRAGGRNWGCELGFKISLKHATLMQNITRPRYVPTLVWRLKQ